MSLWQDPESRAKSKPLAECPLFEQAHARNSDPKHSHEAAKSITNLGQVREQILALFKAFPRGMTDEELVYFFRETKDIRRDWKDASVSGIRSRRSELVRMGFVVEAGEGVTASGRKCSIWRLK